MAVMPRPTFEPPLPPGRTVELAGRGRTFVRDTDGPPGAPTLLLLHGLAATADLNWLTAFETLAGRFRVLALDHRGHGRGIRTREPFTLEDCADDAAAVAREAGAAHVIAVGYSMGGPVAQLVWRRHRDLVSGLVLAATSRNFAGRVGERMFYGMLQPAAAALRIAPPELMRFATRGMLNGRMPDSEIGRWTARQLASGDLRMKVEAMRAVGAFSSHDWISDVDVPAAVVVTTLDRFVHPRRQLKLANAIPGASVHLLHTDHDAPARTEPFAPVMLEACMDVARRI